MLHIGHSFYGAQRVGPGIEPFGRHSLKGNRIFFWILRSELHGVKHLFICRIIQYITEEWIFDRSFVRFRGQSILQYYLRFECENCFWNQPTRAIISGDFASLTHREPTREISKSFKGSSWRIKNATKTVIFQRLLIRIPT